MKMCGNASPKALQLRQLIWNCCRGHCAVLRLFLNEQEILTMKYLREHFSTFLSVSKASSLDNVSLMLVFP